MGASLSADHSASVTRLTAIDALRGLASVGILLHHFGDGVGMGDWRHPLYILVDIFFILSGYILCHRYGHAIHMREVRFREFFLLRIIRLWPLHVVWLLIAVGIYALPLFYSEPFGWMNFFGNIFLLQATGVMPPSWGAGYNPPAWSISAELWINLLWFWVMIWGVKYTRMLIPAMIFLPALAFVFYNDGSLQTIVPTTKPDGHMHGEIALFSGVLNAALLRCCMSYFIGVGLFLTRNQWQYCIPSLLHGVAAGIAGIYLVIHMACGYSSPIGVSDDLLIVGIIFPILFTAILRFAMPQRILAHAVFLHLGMISYSLYLVQYPLGILYKYIGNQSSEAIRESLVWNIGFFVLVWAVAVLSYRFIELPARKWGRAHLIKGSQTF